MIKNIDPFVLELDASGSGSMNAQARFPQTDVDLEVDAGAELLAAYEGSETRPLL